MIAFDISTLAPALARLMTLNPCLGNMGTFSRVRTL